NDRDGRCCRTNDQPRRQPTVGQTSSQFAYGISHDGSDDGSERRLRYRDRSSERSHSTPTFRTCKFDRRISPSRSTIDCQHNLCRISRASELAHCTASYWLVGFLHCTLQEAESFRGIVSQIYCRPCICIMLG